MEQHSVVGSGVARVDALAKVTGRARYCLDEELPGMLYGKVLRSPYAHAKILSIDSSKAERLRRVRSILTGDDVPPRRSGGPRYAFDQYILAREEVLFAGDGVAAVAADTLEVAEKAIELIDIDYEQLPGVFEVEEAWGTQPPVIVHPELPSYEQALPFFRLEPDRPNVCNHHMIRHGDVEKGFRQADLVVENRFTTSRIQHCALEPHNCIARVDADGTLVLHSGRQGIYGAKQQLCRTLSLPPSKVRIISSYYVGGGFGSKFMFTVEPIAALLAMKTGRPVKMALTREEVFSVGGNRIPCIIYIKDGVRRDGTLVAREIKLLVDVGAYASTGGTMLSRNALFGTTGVYRIPNLKVDSYAVYTNNPPVCALRGFASEQATWAIESHMDIIAEQLGMDAVEVRRKNLLSEGDINGNGETVHSIGAERCLDKVAEFLDYHALEDDRGPWRHGRGKAIGSKFSFSSACSITIVKIREDGTIEVRYTADEMGQGCNTVMAQIAAEEFGVSMDRVKVVWGDTAFTPYSTQSLSQGTTFNVGNSTRLACQDAKRQLFEIAAEKLGDVPQNLATQNGMVYSPLNPSVSIAIADLYNRGYVDRFGEILGKAVWSQPFATDTETMQVSRELAEQGIGLAAFYAYSAQGAEVAVNVETGEVEVVRFGTAVDMGFPINPKMCEQQMEGGACIGIGSALWEEVLLDEGKVLDPTLRSYKIPTALNVPRLKDFATFVAPSAHNKGPYGAKGMGEVVLVPTAPAIANAVYNAVGVRITALPITREKLFHALRESHKYIESQEMTTR